MLGYRGGGTVRKRFEGSERGEATGYSAREVRRAEGKRDAPPRFQPATMELLARCRGIKLQEKKDLPQRCPLRHAESQGVQRGTHLVVSIVDG